VLKLEENVVRHVESQRGRWIVNIDGSDREGCGSSWPVQWNIVDQGRIVFIILTFN
jgi:hypothetical protein